MAAPLLTNDQEFEHTVRKAGCTPETMNGATWLVILGWLRWAYELGLGHKIIGSLESKPGNTECSNEWPPFDEMTNTIAQRAFRNAMTTPDGVTPNTAQHFDKARAAARRALVEFGTEPHIPGFDSEPKIPIIRECPFEDKLCPTCGLELKLCPSGWVCENGHGF